MNSYNQTDQRIHYLSQILAKTGRTFVEKKEDDSHTNLGFVPSTNWLETHWIESPKGKIKLVLRITDFCILWLDEKGEAFQTISTVLKTQEEVEDQLKKGIKEAGLDPEGFSEPLHFEIPDYTFVGKPFQMINRHNLDEWTQWRTLANEACGKVLGILDAGVPIRIWPHHFDTGIYVQATDEPGIGFGLAMKDEMAGAPYFYMSGYPSEGKLDYSEAPELTSGRWEITEGFKGAILPLTEYEEVQEALDQYIEQSIQWFLRQ
ncbi:MAG: hypothetical protein JJ971_13235 [Balneolaceae bacterium]|nr:hypothetical protein [Balneolaceae bacterium]MBO6547182.1 hypothetical protein [Balneolaceae bacterium]MBO6647871.1 hypothetical protein [Balneolaceae bacterium]